MRPKVHRNGTPGPLWVHRFVMPVMLLIMLTKLAPINWGKIHRSR
jgi:hypothetical protein